MDKIREFKINNNILAIEGIRKAKYFKVIFNNTTILKTNNMQEAQKIYNSYLNKLLADESRNNYASIKTYEKIDKITYCQKINKGHHWIRINK